MGWLEGQFRLGIIINSGGVGANQRRKMQVVNIITKRINIIDTLSHLREGEGDKRSRLLALH